MTRSTRIILGATLALVLVIGAAVGLVADAFLSTPDFNVLKTDSVEYTIKLADGTKSTRRVGPKAPGWVSLPNISNHLLMAVIASEDTSFFSHQGVDYHELREAVRKDLEEKRWARGASTLTQQVIKNLFLSPEKSIWRKVKEIIWAGKIEKVLSKSQILCVYVNMAEWGPGLYGIGNAARYYFGVSPAELTPRQSAFLAMLLPSPIKYHIYFQKKALTKFASTRVSQILRIMNRMGFIEDAEYEAARRESLWGETPDVVDPDSAPMVTEDQDVPALSSPKPKDESISVDETSVSRPAPNSIPEEKEEVTPPPSASEPPTDSIE